MNYQLDDELISLEKNRIPANLKLFPMMNAISGRFKCESDDNVTVTEYSISGYEGAPLSTLVIEPKNAETVLPCLVYYHGGGFMLKSSAINHQIVKEYAAKVPCKVVYVDYRLAPDYPFPIPVEDCFATYMEVAEFDALHDEGVFFYERLKECGIDVVLHEIKGACHGFENAFESSITRQCMERRIQWIRKHMF